MMLFNSKYPNYFVGYDKNKNVHMFRVGNDVPLKPDKTCTRSRVYTLSINNNKKRVTLKEFMRGSFTEKNIA